MTDARSCMPDHGSYHYTDTESWCADCGQRWLIPAGATNPEIVAASIKELLAYEIDGGTCRNLPRSFDGLHSLFDANMLADHLVSQRVATGESWVDVIRPVQDAIDQWLRQHASAGG